MSLAHDVARLGKAQAVVKYPAYAADRDLDRCSEQLLHSPTRPQIQDVLIEEDQQLIPCRSRGAPGVSV